MPPPASLGVPAPPTDRALGLSPPAPDNDYYRLFTPDAGPLTIQVVFFHAQGDVDAQLLNAAGAVLTTSAGASDSETIAWPAARNTVYYLHVYGYNGAANPNYQLTING